MIELDLMGYPTTLRTVQTLATRAEDAGLGAVWFTESGRTAYLSCTAAALATKRIGIGTAVAVAFPRSPMVTAKIAWELADATNGRFVLGLGTQVKAHVERRYSTAYTPPGPRLRDYVRSLRAIFAAFRGAPLAFESEYYQFSLLTPQWSPGPIDAPDPPIYVAAVLPWMSRMAGAECDGVHVHPFHSPEYLRDVQVPAVAEGAHGAGRELSDITFEIPVMTGVGGSAEEIAATREHARSMVAFYGSTRTYAPVFEHHGFPGLADQLHERQRNGDVRGMVDLITDDVLDHYCVSAHWDDLADVLVERYQGVAPSVRLMTYTAIVQYRSDPTVLERWGGVAQRVRDLTGADRA
ncbi:MAG: TIGR03617 family F420-dependent LLM class oxidoreductase [Actinomycetes bacterium]